MDAWKIAEEAGNVDVPEPEPEEDSWWWLVPLAVFWALLGALLLLSRD